MKSQLHLNRFTLSLVILVIVTGLLLAACGGAAQPKTYTIGIASEFSPDEILDGFKATMTGLGYVEGKNITYVHHGVLGGGQQANETEIKNLLDQKVDLLLTLGSASSKVAQKAVEGTTTPVVFVPAADPVREGLVASITHPGGNLTGIQEVNRAPKTLEWLLAIAPGTKRVYVPYHAADRIGLISTQPLPDAAAQLGLELVLDEVNSGDEVLAAIKDLPQGSAVLLPISPSLDPSLDDILELAIELHIPTASTTDAINEKLLFSYANNLPLAGEQAARLVDKIIKGIKPGDLPVETMEFSLVIRLKTAEAIGLNIPDMTLRQADTIIR